MAHVWKQATRLHWNPIVNLISPDILVIQMVGPVWWMNLPGIATPNAQPAGRVLVFASNLDRQVDTDCTVE